MKRTFLSKLHRNGVYYLIGALLLLLGAPLYQLVVLVPQGYSDAIAATASGHFDFYLLWIANHMGQFIGYRALLVIAFALLFSHSFTLFRIIVAQEILGPEQEQAQLSAEGGGEDEKTERVEAMPSDAWRGKGYAVIAAWSGLLGIVLYVLGTLAGSIYLASIASTFTNHTPSNFSALSSLFAITTNSAGGGLLAVSCLFFGAVIASKGRRLWPGIWVAFGYMAIALAALFSGSAVAVANTPTIAQTVLTTLAILGFAIWVLWFAVMLVRLKPEP